MVLIDGLSGNIRHFNSIFVPALNDIGKRVEKIKDPYLRIVFAGFLSLMAKRVLDYFFKPGQGNLIKVVKNYTREDADEFLVTLIVWFWIDAVDLGTLDKQKSKVVLSEILDIPKQELEDRIKELGHDRIGDKEVLWKQISKILSINQDSREGFLAFNIQFSRICKEAYLEMGNTLGEL